MDFLDIIIFVIEIIGTVAFSFSGSMIAIRRHLDAFGVVFIALTTSFGGGIIRDIIIGQLPPSGFSSYHLILVAFLTSVLTFIVVYFFNKSIPDEKNHKLTRVIDVLIIIFDSLGLSAFAVTGVQIALDTSHASNPVLCIFLGMITTVGGGMLRDIFCDEIPYIFKKHVYACAALAGSAVYYFLVSTSLGTIATAIISMSVVFTIRMLAATFKWNFPRIDH